ncbi:MAG: Smr/MutS family protein [Bacteroidota bacterium]
MGEVRAFQKGDCVRIRGQEPIGEIVQIRGGYAQVAFQFIKVNILLSRLEQVPTTTPTSATASPSQPATPILNLDADAFSAFNPEIDLHGMLVHEAISTVDQWIDRASVLGHKQLKIIHGKGTGALRNALRTYLQAHSQVKRVIDRHPFPGGDGVTWLEVY